MYKVYDIANDYELIISSSDANDVAVSLVELCRKNNRPTQWESVISHYCIHLNDHCVCEDDLAWRSAFNKLAAESKP